MSAESDLILSSVGSINPDAPVGLQVLKDPPAVFCWCASTFIFKPLVLSVIVSMLVILSAFALLRLNPDCEYHVISGLVRSNQQEGHLVGLLSRSLH